MDIVPSHKRQRRDSSAGATASSTIPVASTEKPIVRDENYYRETGDCVILVDRVLFKIHRVLLDRDASAFSNMFSLPQENANNRTNSDENPLVLYDDVEDFRALCWIMYALPTEYSQQHSIETANIQKLVSLFLISHKYHCEAHETFARNLLDKHCMTLLASPNFKALRKYNYFFTCPESRLEAILRIVILTKQTSELNPTMLQKIWKYRLKMIKGSISYALGVAEALGLRKFVGELYYIELTRMKPVPLQGSPAYVHRTVSALEPHQQLALNRGNWSLRCYWSKTLREQPEQFECSVPEDDDHTCGEVWGEGWNEVDDKQWDSSPFHPLKELLKVQTNIISAYGRDDESWAPCALNFITSMIDYFNDHIADHFLGPPSPIDVGPSASS